MAKKARNKAATAARYEGVHSRTDRLFDSLLDRTDSNDVRQLLAALHWIGVLIEEVSIALCGDDGLDKKLDALIEAVETARSGE